MQDGYGWHMMAWSLPLGVFVYHVSESERILLMLEVPMPSAMFFGLINPSHPIPRRVVRRGPNECMCPPLFQIHFSSQIGTHGALGGDEVEVLGSTSGTKMLGHWYARIKEK